MSYLILSQRRTPLLFECAAFSTATAAAVAQPVIEPPDPHVLIDERDDLHVVLSPGAVHVPDLDLDDLGSQGAHSGAVEAGDQPLHDKRRLVLDEVVFDALGLVLAGGVHELEKRGDRVVHDSREGEGGVWGGEDEVHGFFVLFLGEVYYF